MRFLFCIRCRQDSVNQIFHLKLTTYICRNGSAYPYPLFENIGHINEGGGYPQRPNNRKGRLETPLSAEKQG